MIPFLPLILFYFGLVLAILVHVNALTMNDKMKTKTYLIISPVIFLLASAVAKYIGG